MHQLHPDVKSAIERARTKLCKKKILEVSIQLEFESLYPTEIKRSCGLDLAGHPRNRLLGCIDASKLSDVKKSVILLEQVISDQSDCLETCFSYGQVQAGFWEPERKCFCSETSLENQVSQVCPSSHDRFEWFSINEGIYYKAPETHKKGPKHKPLSGNRCKILFLLVLSGKSISQVERLLRTIYSSYHIYYLHVDKRDNHLHEGLLRLEQSYKNVIVTKDRYATIWGGPALLDMTLNSMEKLIDLEWDYIINLSNSDFPVKPLNQLESFLSDKATDEAIFLKSHSMNGYKFVRKQGLDKNFYQCEDRVWRLGPRKLPRGIVYSGGSDWFALPKKFSKFVVDDAKVDGSLVKSLLNVYRYTILPVESFFHTIAINSRFCDKFNEGNLRLTNWNRKQGCNCQHKNVVDWCGCSPLVFRSSDWPRLNQTRNQDNIFFARKFDPQISMPIINNVEHFLLGIKTRSMNDTRY